MSAPARRVTRTVRSTRSSLARAATSRSSRGADQQRLHRVVASARVRLHAVGAGPRRPRVPHPRHRHPDRARRQDRPAGLQGPRRRRRPDVLRVTDRRRQPRLLLTEERMTFVLDAATSTRKSRRTISARCRSPPRDCRRRDLHPDRVEAVQDRRVTVDRLTARTDSTGHGHQIEFRSRPRILTIVFTLVWLAGWLLLLVLTALEYARFADQSQREAHEEAEEPSGDRRAE